MEKIIEPVSKELIKSELTVQKRVRSTNKANNEIYVFTAHDSPNLMREVGRLREIAFRHYGGGTGLEADIDKYDTMEIPYRQLIVWDPENEEILGGYRFIYGSDVEFDEQGKPMLATAHLLNFSQEFIHEYLPYTVELGRSFVSLEYQSTLLGRKGIFALDNLWDGLGALTVIDPDIRYFFGKVTMYGTYNKDARNMILYFLNKHFPDTKQMVTPIEPLVTDTDFGKMKQLFHGRNFKEDYKILNREVRALGYNIPPLINAYMSLSPTMRFFGTAINDEFGQVEESGILIEIDQILEEKRARHIETYLKSKPSKRFLMRLRRIVATKRKR
ncbi:MAG: hemolysin [Bacteroidetes bacterium GWD2_45_23]|nr:MAG: hemolysin [Bacteroidetes bacterium GWC2_46_850]OFX87304.1 MAG: hemolysin [Bacteroidetes bacterium GWD2_45_23]HBB01669.1 hemolysin [Porphyromonadaceae bacterium]HCC17161.1 hemolysin [Porphyromonadaceae bacterium]